MDKFCRVLIVGFSLLIINGGTSLYAQEPFYRGKTVRIVVGFSAGGGFDAYSRAIARHIDKHIPGNPTIVVENMGGAGSMIAANYLYSQAKPDGLTIGNWIGGLILQQYLGAKGVMFDAARFESDWGADTNSQCVRVWERQRHNKLGRMDELKGACQDRR